MLNQIQTLPKRKEAKYWSNIHRQTKEACMLEITKKFGFAVEEIQAKKVLKQGYWVKKNEDKKKTWGQ